MNGGADFWASWQVAPEITLLLILAEYLYLRAVLKDQRWATVRERRFFLAGLLSIAAVICTPIGVRAADLFWCHMVQHITLMMISGPLLVLGTPGAFRPKNQLFQLLTHPLGSWIIYATLMIGVHLPTPHQFIINHTWAHTFLEIPLYIAIPYFFYFNLLDRNLIARRISPAISVISLFLMMVPETLTGFFIYVAPHSLYNRMFTLNDQRLGGSIMWSGGMIIDTVWMAFAVYHWIKSEERASIAVDRQIAEATP